ncbi:hypothetical protein Pisl_1330 [Pyrobaculum islandicum DSM 4184]|uniref:Uncharacterized protein n=1 Tax=Pyrobaculum islandicum (strain DSM 4184 / JCM 9189 / GEO3) TaxID=384616 RepID=A1RU61_PYRIL|nr:hypothetical protein [Pyrobaculum islandicum]ABL88493.1 hypothetical protein Pisl_1330 [Pyrobaculum islandicum DSM 4184]
MGGRLTRDIVSRFPHCLARDGRGCDVVAIANIERRALAEGRVPSGPMPDNPAPETVWLPMKAWTMRKPPGITAWRQAVFRRMCQRGQREGSEGPRER